MPFFILTISDIGEGIISDSDESDDDAEDDADIEEDKAGGELGGVIYSFGGSYD